MFARLTTESGDCSPIAVDLTPGQPATLGRSRDNVVVVRDEMVSRLHAKIFFDDGKWVLRDFGMNGTRVNGNKVNGTVSLADTATVELGDARFRFTANTAAKPVRTPPPVPESIDQTPTSASSNSRVPVGGSSSSVVPRVEPAGGTKVLSHVTRQPEPEPDGSETQLRLDELTALCRYMTAAMVVADQPEMIRHTLRTVLNQTTATVAGYLGLDPADPTPK
ncbi:MAG: FHA domain-containing protein, partial [Fimbriiglobus sp.]